MRSTADEVIRFDDAAAFLDRCGGYLAAREAQHCVMLGFALAARDRPADSAGSPPRMAMYAVFDGDVVRAVAGVTDIAALLSADGTPAQVEAAVTAMADAVLADQPDLHGFEGETPVASAFGRRWEARTGDQARVALRERAHRLDRLVPPTRQAPGRARRVNAGDVPLLGAWIDAFSAEALPHEAPPDGAAIAASWLADPYRDALLWEHDGRPVSMAAAAWPTMTGIRVSAVYTPPEERGRGYATAITAAVTRAQLEAGRRSCFLYTDLANPTSNAIYRSLGYEPVVDVDRCVIDRGSR